MSQATMTSDLSGAARDAVASTKGAVSDLASRVGDAASDLSDSAREALHRGRLNTAKALDSAARGIDAGTDSVSRAGHGAADKVGASAQYVRSHGARELVSDIEALVKRHPGKSLLVVAALGFMAGRALKRD